MQAELIANHSLSLPPPPLGTIRGSSSLPTQFARFRAGEQSGGTPKTMTVAGGRRFGQFK